MDQTLAKWLRDPRIQAMVQTIAEWLREEGKKEGLRIGRKEGYWVGRREGKLACARELLLGLLRRRFKRLPRSLVQQINACTLVEYLQEAVYRVVEIKSLGDLDLYHPPAARART